MAFGKILGSMLKNMSDKDFKEMKKQMESKDDGTIKKGDPRRKSFGPGVRRTKR